MKIRRNEEEYRSKKRKKKLVNDCENNGYRCSEKVCNKILNIQKMHEKQGAENQ